MLAPHPDFGRQSEKFGCRSFFILNCQTEIISLILKKGAHYFIALKANQRALRYSVRTPYQV